MVTRGLRCLTTLFAKKFDFYGLHHRARSLNRLELLMIAVGVRRKSNDAVCLG